MVNQNLLLVLSIVAVVFSINCLSCDAGATRNKELDRGNGRINNAISWMKKQVRKLKKNMNDVLDEVDNIEVNAANISAIADEVANNTEQIQNNTIDIASILAIDIEFTTEELPTTTSVPTNVMLITGEQFPNSFVSLDGTTNCSVTTGRGTDDHPCVGLIDYTIPITCGGGCGGDKCWNIIDGSVYANLLTRKSASAFIQINPSTLWLTGGGCGFVGGSVSGAKIQRETEYISSTPGITGPGPDLPIEMKGHCMAKSGDLVYVMGGRTNTGAEIRITDVYIYDFSQFPTVTGPVNGPSLNLDTGYFMCGALANGAIIWAGGDSGEGRTNRVEILLPGASSWVAVTPIPSAWRWWSHMLTKDNVAYLIGGYDASASYANDIIKMECDEFGTCSEWETVGYFHRGRYGHKALWIPESLVPC